MREGKPIALENYTCRESDLKFMNLAEKRGEIAKKKCLS